MNSIVLFDGICNFCDASVQFIIKNDPKGNFRFASLQSDIGQKLLKEYNVPADVDSIVLIENDKAYCKSAAALKICRHLNGLWKIAYTFIIIPAPLRNLVYDLIARNRYKWFGKKESCILPSPEVQSRFLS
ncbi:thiol-disulfide oxidoreductase DCC family protein [Siminovitchia acidinfaciens]|uniref:Thiol-disulfide oxidoreductase DCC family protein n=1 Tax=Siminovitchia acidinfaciens TaxID=2321395 RepID=A0A429XWH7_9BACI|nr:thiol-disulfide oxidoreductase DCC family protein [Siminovitchia acidinfaciens]RST72743.1 thiol-disulfide oxidoreductase DCC family protein [Siminovitchia acidinfaciens]